MKSRQEKRKNAHGKKKGKTGVRSQRAGRGEAIFVQLKGEACKHGAWPREGVGTAVTESRGTRDVVWRK